MEEYNAKAEDEIMRYCWMEGYLRLYSLVVGYDPLTLARSGVEPISQMRDIHRTGCRNARR